MLLSLKSFRQDGVASHCLCSVPSALNILPHFDLASSHSSEDMSRWSVGSVLSLAGLREVRLKPFVAMSQDAPHLVLVVSELLGECERSIELLAVDEDALIPVRGGVASILFRPLVASLLLLQSSLRFGARTSPTYADRLEFSGERSSVNLQTCALGEHAERDLTRVLVLLLHLLPDPIESNELLRSDLGRTPSPLYATALVRKATKSTAA